MKILITGASGQLGSELKRILRSKRAEIGPIPALYSRAEVVPVGRAEFDIADAAATGAFFSDKGFDLVINCAAMTNVDGCDTHEEAAYQVNAVGAQNLARASQASGAKFVQISTDYVFSGDAEVERTEEDEPAPKSAYGRTKLAGELLSLAACERTFVVRTAWLYGYVGRNFVKTMIRLGRTHKRVTVVEDQLGNPTSANDLAYEILAIAATDSYGIYHCTNNGICSWADFATSIIAAAGLACEVVPVTSAQYREANPQSADRPHFSALANARLATGIGDRMRPWREAFAQFMVNLPKLEDVPVA